jgi:hypothetical protein
MMSWGVLFVFFFMWVGFVCCYLSKSASFMNLWCLGLVFWTSILQFLAKMGAMQLIPKAHYKDFLQDMTLLLRVCEGRAKYHVLFLSKQDAYVDMKLLFCDYFGVE